MGGTSVNDPRFRPASGSSWTGEQTGVGSANGTGASASQIDPKLGLALSAAQLRAQSPDTSSIIQESPNTTSGSGTQGLNSGLAQLESIGQNPNQTTTTAGQDGQQPTGSGQSQTTGQPTGTQPAPSQQQGPNDQQTTQTSTGANGCACTGDTCGTNNNPFGYDHSGDANYNLRQDQDTTDPKKPTVYGQYQGSGEAHSFSLTNGEKGDGTTAKKNEVTLEFQDRGSRTDMSTPRKDKARNDERSKFAQRLTSNTSSGKTDANGNEVITRQDILDRWSGDKGERRAGAEQFADSLGLKDDKSTMTTGQFQAAMDKLMDKIDQADGITDGKINREKYDSIMSNTGKIQEILGNGGQPPAVPGSDALPAPGTTTQQSTPAQDRENERRKIENAFQYGAIDEATRKAGLAKLDAEEAKTQQGNGGQQAASGAKPTSVEDAKKQLQTLEADTKMPEKEKNARRQELQQFIDQAKQPATASQQPAAETSQQQKDQNKPEGISAKLNGYDQLITGYEKKGSGYLTQDDRSKLFNILDEFVDPAKRKDPAVQKLCDRAYTLLVR